MKVLIDTTYDRGIELTLQKLELHLVRGLRDAPEEAVKTSKISEDQMNKAYNFLEQGSKL